jgi:hypothetical protein
MAYEHRSNVHGISALPSSLRVKPEKDVLLDVPRGFNIMGGYFFSQEMLQ